MEQAFQINRGGEMIQQQMCQYCGKVFNTEFYSNGSISHSNVINNIEVHLHRFESGEKEEAFLYILGLSRHFTELTDIKKETIEDNFNCCIKILESGNKHEFVKYLKSREHEIVSYFNKGKDYMIKDLNQQINEIKTHITRIESEKISEEVTK